MTTTTTATTAAAAATTTKTTKEQQTLRAIASLRLAWPNTKTIYLEFIRFFWAHWISCLKQICTTHTQHTHFIHPFCQRHFGSNNETKIRSYNFVLFYFLRLHFQFGCYCCFCNSLCLVCVCGNNFVWLHLFLRSMNEWTNEIFLQTHACIVMSVLNKKIARAHTHNLYRQFHTNSDDFCSHGLRLRSKSQKNQNFEPIWEPVD